MTTIDILAMAKRARAATRTIATSTTAQRNVALAKIAEYLNNPAEQTAILAANAIDMQNAQAAGLRPALLDRMLLTPQRLHAIANDIAAVIALPDPVGEIFEQGVLPNK